jgi:hypothetical protein
VFSSAISFVARIDAPLYFAQGTSGTDGQRIYYSFTVLTTTGRMSRSPWNFVTAVLD